MSEKDVPTLGEADPMDLPAGATVSPDGSVTLSLGHPFDLEFRAKGSDTVQSEHFDHLVLHRLGGADVRKMLAAPNSPRQGLALSLGIPLAKLVLIRTKIDARDETAASNVVNELLGGLKLGLPAEAEETDSGIILSLRRPVTDEQGELISEITFSRITSRQKDLILRSQSPLDWGLATASGLSPKAAKALVDLVDGADAIAIHMVILVLCGGSRGTAG